MLINFRPHHLICNLCFQGKGYSEKFVQNFLVIHQQINQVPEQSIIKLVAGVDDICACCPANINGQCEQATTVEQLDQGYLSKLKFKIGDIVSLAELKTRIKKFMLLQDFQQVCSSCSWYSLGVCEKKIGEVLKS